jgi:hypothetical protein
MKNLALIFLCILPLGCSGYFIYDKTEIPDTEKALIEFVASKESQIEGLEKELEEAKLSRDIVSKKFDETTGWWAKDDMRRSLNNANRDIEFIGVKLTNAKTYLGRARAKLGNLQEKK